MDDKQYECQRCGYKCQFKSHIVKHLSRKFPCHPLLNDIPVMDLLALLPPDPEPKYFCGKCKKGFINRQSKYVHQKSCKKHPPPPPPDPIQIKLDELQSKFNELETKLTGKDPKDTNTLTATDRKDTSPDFQKVLLELQYYKNRKNERFYQLMLEQFLCGTHKTLSCGITDVTTDTCHAEIKEWKNWKEAVGQLTCYNAVDPKPELCVYLFGKYTSTCKEQAVSVCKTCGIRPYEFVESAVDCSVSIQDCITNNQVYTFTVLK